MATANKATGSTKPKARKVTPRPRKTAKTIRNLRGTQVHARLFSLSKKDPFRIELQPRGQNGDITIVPVTLIEDATFVSGVGVLWEVITTAEANVVRDAYSPVGYLGRTDAPVIIRPDENTIMTAKDYDGKGRQVPKEREVVHKERGSDIQEREFGTGMHTADVPGSDQALHAMLKAGQSALPPDANFDRSRVRIERVKGE